MKQGNNLRSKVFSIGLAVALGISPFISNCTNPESKNISENIQMNSNVLLCFRKHLGNKNNDARLFTINKSNTNVINLQGDTLPLYVYYSGPIPSEIYSINNIDSLEVLVNNTLDIRQVIVDNLNNGMGDTTLAIKSKYKPIVARAIIDATKVYKHLIEFKGYH